MKEIVQKYNFVFLISFLVLIDQASKYLIRHFDGFYICNPGISFGFFIPHIIFYPLVAIIFVASFLYLFKKINSTSFAPDKIGLSFVLGGALANLIDRFNLGCIVDFIDLNFFPVFNLADIFITLGVIIIVIKSSRK